MKSIVKKGISILMMVMIAAAFAMPVVAAPLTTTQILALTPSKFAALTPTQIAALTYGQFAALKPPQIAAMTSAQIAALTIIQIAALQSAQIAALTPAQIKVLKDAQIKALRPEQIMALTPDQISVVTDVQQIRALTPAQIAALMPAQIAALTPDQIKMLMPDQIAALTSTQFGALLPAQILAFQPSQIKYLSAANMPLFLAKQPKADAEATNRLLKEKLALIAALDRANSVAKGWDDGAKEMVVVFAKADAKLQAAIQANYNAKTAAKKFATPFKPACTATDLPNCEKIRAAFHACALVEPLATQTEKTFATCVNAKMKEPESKDTPAKAIAAAKLSALIQMGVASEAALALRKFYDANPSVPKDPVKN